MGYRLLFIFLAMSKLVTAQDSSTVFDNKIKLNEGVYTSINEVLENNPKYFNCSFEIKVNAWFGGITIYYFDGLGTKHEFKDTILLVVQDNERYVNYKSRFYKLLLTGAISTFTIKTIYRDIGYSDIQQELYFFDIKSGIIDKLNPTNINKIIMRDNLLYSNYSTISNSKKKKTLYSYILKFNKNNPIYVNPE
jgi:hypothetical protein